MGCIRQDFDKADGMRGKCRAQGFRDRLPGRAFQLYLFHADIVVAFRAFSCDGQQAEARAREASLCLRRQGARFRRVLVDCRDDQGLIPASPGGQHIQHRHGFQTPAS